MRRLALPLLIACAVVVTAAGCSSSGESATGAGAVELRVRWRYAEGFPGEITIHKALAGQEESETRVFPAGEAPELGDVIGDGTLRSSFGETRRFVAAYRNPTQETVRFWVAPHLPEPYGAEAGLLVLCLCTGEQYEVPPGGTWTRVMSLGLNRRAGTTEPVTVTHVVVLGDLPSGN